MSRIFFSDSDMLRCQMVYSVKEFFCPIWIVGRNDDYGKTMYPAFLFHARTVVDQEINPESGRVFAAWLRLEIVPIQIDDAVQIESIGMKQTRNIFLGTAGGRIDPNLMTSGLQMPEEPFGSPAKSFL